MCAPRKCSSVFSGGCAARGVSDSKKSLKFYFQENHRRALRKTFCGSKNVLDKCVTLRADFTATFVEKRFSTGKR